jgi:hypothetical protein
MQTGSLVSVYSPSCPLLYLTVLRKFRWHLPIDLPPTYKTLTEPVSFDNPKALALPVTYVPFFKRGLACLSGYF